VEREIEDLETLIAEAGGSAFVFGGSSGGMLALDAAAHGAAITRLAAYETPLNVDDSSPPLPDNYLSRLIELLEADRRSDAVEHWFTEGLHLPEQAVAGCAASHSG
jgi:pimeloyl-ACP methyl ester carboxylesterase